MRAQAKAAGSHSPNQTGEEVEALNYLFSVTYEELKRVAALVRQGDPSVTLNPTALVNEAWIKLSKSPELGRLEPLHFKRIAARAMRQLLVEAARRRGTQKRHAPPEMLPPDWDKIQAEDPATHEEQMMALDEALNELATFDSRQAAIVEARFFGGLEVNEIAALLDISESTVLRDWRLARAWLGRRISEHK